MFSAIFSYCISFIGGRVAGAQLVENSAGADLLASELDIFEFAWGKGAAAAIGEEDIADIFSKYDGLKLETQGDRIYNSQKGDRIYNSQIKRRELIDISEDGSTQYQTSDLATETTAPESAAQHDSGALGVTNRLQSPSTNNPAHAATESPMDLEASTPANIEEDPAATTPESVEQPDGNTNRLQSPLSTADLNPVSPGSPDTTFQPLFDQNPDVPGTSLPVTDPDSLATATTRRPGPDAAAQTTTAAAAAGSRDDFGDSETSGALESEATEPLRDGRPAGASGTFSASAPVLQRPSETESAVTATLSDGGSARPPGEAGAVSVVSTASAAAAAAGDAAAGGLGATTAVAEGQYIDSDLPFTTPWEADSSPSIAAAAGGRPVTTAAADRIDAAAHSSPRPATPAAAPDARPDSGAGDATPGRGVGAATTSVAPPRGPPAAAGSWAASPAPASPSTAAAQVPAVDASAPPRHPPTTTRAGAAPDVFATSAAAPGPVGGGGGGVGGGDSSQTETYAGKPPLPPPPPAAGGPPVTLPADTPAGPASLSLAALDAAATQQVLPGLDWLGPVPTYYSAALGAPSPTARTVFRPAGRLEIVVEPGVWPAAGRRGAVPALQLTLFRPAAVGGDGGGLPGGLCGPAVLLGPANVVLGGNIRVSLPCEVTAGAAPGAAPAAFTLRAPAVGAGGGSAGGWEPAAGGAPAATNLTATAADGAVWGSFSALGAISAFLVAAPSTPPPPPPPSESAVRADMIVGAAVGAAVMMSATGLCVWQLRRHGAGACGARGGAEDGEGGIQRKQARQTGSLRQASDCRTDFRATRRPPPSLLPPSLPPPSSPSPSFCPPSPPSLPPSLPPQPRTLPDSYAAVCCDPRLPDPTDNPQRRPGRPRRRPPDADRRRAGRKARSALLPPPAGGRPAGGLGGQHPAETVPPGGLGGLGERLSPATRRPPSRPTYPPSPPPPPFLSPTCQKCGF